MVKLNKGEKSLWQMSYEMYLIDNNKECDIEYFMLTSQNIRVEYLRKVSLFRKEAVQIVIPLTEDINISYHDTEEDTIELAVDTADNSYSFMVCYSRKKSCEKKIDQFIEKVYDIVKKNISSLTIPTNQSVVQRGVGSILSPIDSIDRIEIRSFLTDLGPSKLELNDKNIKKIKTLFPVPVEHKIIWADCEFDLRCSGIVCTDKGCFIKSNVAAVNLKKKKDQNQNRSILYYYKWANFSPTYFTDDTETNYVLKVEPQCQQAFLTACKAHAEKIRQTEIQMQEFDDTDFQSYVGIVAGITAGVAAAPNQNLDFLDQYIRNVQGRHGFFAEQANNMKDITLGRNATVIGGDNAKNGADRLIKRVFLRDQYIQTKYCKTAADSLKAAFGRDGLYRYVSDQNGVMQLEVPSDQYDTVVDLFKDKIRQGKVPDGKGGFVTNPAEAQRIVRKGHYTYDQAVKMAEPGNIESLKYDIQTGMVTCLFAFGISSLITMVVSFRQHRDFGRAVKDGLQTGIKVFGLTMINHVLLSQLYKTKWFQNFTGNILLRNTLITSGASLIVYSIPDIIRVLSKNISFGQFLKNTAVLGGTIAGGAGGACIGGEIGESVCGKMGKAVGAVLGGLIGGIAGTVASKGVSDVFREDDIQIFSRLFHAQIQSMVIDYMLSEKEIDLLTKKLKSVDKDDLKALNSKFRKSNSQENVIVSFLNPIFQSIVNTRKPFSVPDSETIIKGFVALA